MSRKTMIIIGMITGSIIGQYLVIFLGTDTFSVTAVLGSGAGGMTGVWLGYKLNR